MWDRVGKIGESGEYRMERVRVVCFHVWRSQSSSPCLCQLRADRLASVNKIDYVLAHRGFMGSHKLSSFDGHWVRQYLTSLNGCTLGLCVGYQHMPIEVSCGRHALGRDRIWPDSLIVIAKGGHSWCLHGSRVSYCQVNSLARCILVWISMTP
jgi:hypothetical protein